MARINYFASWASLLNWRTSHNEQTNWRRSPGQMEFPSPPPVSPSESEASKSKEVANSNWTCGVQHKHLFACVVALLRCVVLSCVSLLCNLSWEIGTSNTLFKLSLLFASLLLLLRRICSLHCNHLLLPHNTAATEPTTQPTTTTTTSPLRMH